MSISETQLRTWANPQTGTGARFTHHAIRRALQDQEPPEGYTWKVYLQGSYKNATNTRGNHDVDVVVELTSHVEVAEDHVSWAELRPFYAFVSRAMRQTFGFAVVSERPKCIRVAGEGKRVDADVVVAVSYLKPLGRKYEPGIRLYTGLAGNRTINFPEAHFRNGAAKNKNTRGRYHRTVRMFKNARNYIGRKTWFPPRVPSYHLECLLFNVPNRCYVDSLQRTYVRATSWILQELENDPSGLDFTCQNRMQELFGDEDIHWNATDARRCVEGLGHLWNNGLRS